MSIEHSPSLCAEGSITKSCFCSCRKCEHRWEVVDHKKKERKLVGLTICYRDPLNKRHLMNGGMVGGIFGIKSE